MGRLIRTYHLIFIGRPLEHIPRSLDVQQDVGKDTDGILVAPHHQVGKAHIVVGGDLTLRNTGIHALTEDKKRVSLEEQKRKETGIKLNVTQDVQPYLQLLLKSLEL